MRIISLFLIIYLAAFINPSGTDAGIFEKTKSRLIGNWSREYGERIV
jgi:hypothetical protein